MIYMKQKTKQKKNQIVKQVPTPPLHTRKHFQGQGSQHYGSLQPQHSPAGRGQSQFLLGAETPRKDRLLPPSLLQILTGVTS